MSEINPYEAPKSEQSDAPIDRLTIDRSRRLYSSDAVGIASFFGTPLAGGILMALNARMLHEGRAGRLALGLSVLLVPIYLLSIIFLGYLWDPLSFFAGIIWSYVMRGVARVFQQDDVVIHIKQGGPLASNWWAVGVGLVTAVGLILVAFLVLLLLSLFLVGVNNISA